jgi:hypothetical protein
MADEPKVPSNFSALHDIGLRTTPWSASIPTDSGGCPPVE